MNRNSKLYSISFVVIGPNEEKMIWRRIESISGLDYPRDKIEIIYVDSGSTDRTLEIVSKYPIKIMQLKTDNPSPASGRNEGFKISKGELVQFVDGDCMIDPQWLKNSLPCIADDAIACITGRRTELFPGKSVYNRLIDVTWQDAPSGYVDTPGGGGLFKRAILEEVGLYDPNVTAEEADLGYRIRRQNYKILNIMNGMVWHDVKISNLFEYLKRAKRNGYGTGQIFKKYWHSKDKPTRYYSSVIKADIQVILFIALLLAFVLRSFLIGYVLTFFALVFIIRKFIRGYVSSKSIWTSFLFVFMSFLSRCARFIGYVRCAIPGRRMIT